MARSKKKFRSLSEVFAAPNCDEILMLFLRNMGCEHLAADRHSTGRDGLNRYLMSLVGEYGVPEAAAEREVLAEINNLVL